MWSIWQSKTFSQCRDIETATKALTPSPWRLISRSATPQDVFYIKMSSFRDCTNLFKKKHRLRNKTYTTSSPPTSTISNTTNNPNKYIEIKCIFFLILVISINTKSVMYFKVNQSVAYLCMLLWKSVHQDREHSRSDSRGKKELNRKRCKGSWWNKCKWHSK